MNAMKSPAISSFAKSIYSQNGEDGIIAELLARIESQIPLDKWCVEFGALDGIKYSNTYNLIIGKGYRAVLIEGDKKKFRKLCENIPQENVIKLCRFVTLEGSSTLEKILRGTSIPIEFDFLSIDIDGCDYHIFSSLNEYQPKIVCIEYNPNIPNEIEFVQSPDFSVKQGSSAKSTILLAKSKGYFLAACTASNLIFVRNEFRTSVEESTIDALRNDAELRTLIFFGYDGTLLSNRDRIYVPWHRLTIRPKDLQIIPRYLRLFGEDYNFVQKVLFALFVLLNFPGSFKGLFREKILMKWKTRVKSMRGSPK